jgi:transposase
MDNRKAITAILYVLRTGCQWKALPRTLGASSTVHDRFQQWRRDGVFRRMWINGLKLYDEKVGINWKWQSMDGVITKAPLWGEKAQDQIQLIEPNLVQNAVYLLMVKVFL